MNRKIYNLIDNTSIGNRVLNDKIFRAIFFTGTSFIMNIIYGVYNGVLSVIYGSLWFLIMFIYYFVLCAMRLSIVRFEKKKKIFNQEKSVMRYNGFILIVLAIVLSFTVLISTLHPVKRTYSLVIMISIATYTFYITVLAIINSIKARKTNSIILITIRNISLASATAAMLSLERSMISTFSPNDKSLSFVMDTCTGAGAFLIVIALGISMIIKSYTLKE